MSTTAILAAVSSGCLGTIAALLLQEPHLVTSPSVMNVLGSGCLLVLATGAFGVIAIMRGDG
jgi:hypothetical protein